MPEDMPEEMRKKIYGIVSANILSKIKASGMSQNSIARLLGVSSGNFSRQGRSGSFSLERLSKIAEILGCSIADLIA